MSQVAARTKPQIVALANYDFFRRLTALPFVDAVYLFGSRARGENAARADIDLAVVSPRASDADWQRILDIIEDADTLLRIDCVRLETLPGDDPLRQSIERDKVPLFHRERSE